MMMFTSIIITCARFIRDNPNAIALQTDNFPPPPASYLKGCRDCVAISLLSIAIAQTQAGNVDVNVCVYVWVHMYVYNTPGPTSNISQTVDCEHIYSNNTYYKHAERSQTNKIQIFVPKVVDDAFLSVCMFLIIKLNSVPYLPSYHLGYP